MTADTSGADVDFAALKADFPLLNQEGVVYLDSAATSQKPTAVIEAMSTYYETANANVHRGSHNLTAAASQQMEAARKGVARFIGAGSADEIVFTKNATESLNLIVGSWGRANLGPGDAVVITEAEHHANIVPWQMLAAEKGFEIRWIPVREDGHLDLATLPQLLDGASMVSVTSMSNVLGSLTDLDQISAAARAAGALVAVDGCQSVPHLPTDLSAMDIDFMAFSGHKMCGPTGVGVLWGRPELLDDMPPFLGGGGMILTVDKDGFRPDSVPAKFEAGTPPIAEIIGLGAAVTYLNAIGMDAIRAHEVQLTAYFLRSLTERFGEDIVIHGPSEPAERGGVFSFTFKDLHPHDISQVLDQSGVSVRSGHHCAKPLMTTMGVGATARASVYLYNDESDIDKLGDALEAAADLFAF